MRIAHVCLSNFFVDGRLYQENELVRQHVEEGHDVLIIASTETHAADGSITYVEPDEYVAQEGARVIRLPYHPLLPGILGRKLRVHRGVRGLLEDFCPDTIMFHGLCGWEILTVARYARRHPDARFYADSHEDANNSARTPASRVLLHRGFYRPLIRRALPEIDKVLCISLETIDFVASTYGVPRERMEFFPLGGRPIRDPEYGTRRARARAAYGIEEGQVLFVQSGKQTARKRLLESLRAMAAVQDERFRLLIAGSLFEDVREEAQRAIAEDERVTFVGWKSPEELTDLLCAADVYLQPGTQSVTMQHSLCARCAIIIDDVPSHAVYHRGNGWLLNRSQSLAQVLEEVSARAADLPRMQAASFQIAEEMLDYSMLARRVLR